MLASYRSAVATIRGWRDEVGDTTALGAARLVLGLLLLDNGRRAWGELGQGYFGDFFHWPMVAEWLVPPRPVYTALVIAQLVLAALVVAGHRGLARVALFASALAGAYVLSCDRLQFHNNRWALFCDSLLLSLAPCDRSFSVASLACSQATPARAAPGPLWAARLAKVQVSLVYLASGGSKLFDPDWRSGQVLLVRTVLGGARAIEHGVPATVIEWLSRPEVAGALAALAIATELGLAVGLWSPRLRVAALWWGVWFHLTIEATSRVESFTWLTLAMYLPFATPDARARGLLFDASTRSGRICGRAVSLVDWLARFAVQPFAQGDGRHPVVVRRDGTRAAGFDAVVMMARCTPLLFPLWAPLALLAGTRRYLYHSPR
jgi:hypothetical protein